MTKSIGSGGSLKRSCHLCTRAYQLGEIGVENLEPVAVHDTTSCLAGYGTSKVHKARSCIPKLHS